MIYKSFKNQRLSYLGMGNMRLPTNGHHGPIDENKARALIEQAYESGINYFDTGYNYHNGESEKFVGRVLNQYPRQTWYLATKFPGHMLQYKNGQMEFTGYLAGDNLSSPADIFKKQLNKCHVDYFDFYLLHNFCEKSYDIYTNQDLRIVEYLLKQKRDGRIHHLGFSAHARSETIDKFLNMSNGFDFVQIQLNYLDWFLQEADKKYQIITNHGIPVFVMEPCRGGRLAFLNETASAILKKARPNDSIVSWTFRFLQSLPNVQLVLSGMTTMDQLTQNIEIFSQLDPTTEAEKELLHQVVTTMVKLVPCTACRYCCDVCPQGLDIPKLISMYNEICFERHFTYEFTLDAMKETELPSACLSCGNCARICPQEIDIPDIMKKFTKALAKSDKKTFYF